MLTMNVDMVLVTIPVNPLVCISRDFFLALVACCGEGQDFSWNVKPTIEELLLTSDSEYIVTSY